MANSSKDSTASKDKEVSSIVITLGRLVDIQDPVVFHPSSMVSSLLSTRLLLDRAVLPVEETPAMPASS
jgi:hypothetical protein